MSEKVLIVLEVRKFPTEFPEDTVYETMYGDQYFAGDIVSEVVPGYTTDNIFYSADLVDERSHAYETRNQKQLANEQAEAQRYEDTLAQPPTPEQRRHIAKQLELIRDNEG